MAEKPTGWLDAKIPLWGAVMVAGALFAQAVTAQAKIEEHERRLADLAGVAAALSGLTAEVGYLRTDVRDLKNTIRPEARP